MTVTESDLRQRMEFLREEAERLQADAAARTDALQDYIDDEEYEINEMLNEANTLHNEASEIENSLGSHS